MVKLFFFDISSEKGLAFVGTKEFRAGHVEEKDVQKAREASS